ncbi:hypothetical protein OJ998_28275 [Solirubrobacter taibaiensis]|nr:hypothetical protein [Solirubrobacter taibaiensis]
MNKLAPTLALTVLMALAPPAAVAHATDFDLDGVSTPADCNDLDAGIFPGAADRPDLAFVDTNCDGIDGDVAKAVFVDAGGGQDSRSGSRDFPKKSVGNALAAAKAAGKDVYVAAGTYVELLNLESGVGIYGGYTPTFGQRVTTEPTLITGASNAAVADNDTKVVLQLLSLTGANSLSSSYGLRAINGSTVVLEGVTAQGGSAGAGSPALAVITRPARTATGGTGGTLGGCTSGRTGGGAPGSGNAGVGGLGGAGSPAVLGGLSGGAGTSGFFAPGALSGGTPTNGRDGSSPAAPVTTGALATSTPDIAGATWGGASGNTGPLGNPGGGGGGGGGGFGAVNALSGASGAAGGGGGGGGGGGTPGSGGAGGAPGGGSFGVYIFNASVTAVASTLKSGTGGVGGNGAAGQPGGFGGFGGSPGQAVTCTISVGPFSISVTSGDGAFGGPGGDGSQGGSGSGGAGGPSVGVFRAGPGSAFASRDSAATGGTAGLGGATTGGVRSAGGVSGAGLKSAVAPGTGFVGGTADFDGDGIVDANDPCAADAAAGTGCPVRPQPLSDGDGDGVPDSADACPAVAAEGGCPPPPPIIVNPGPGPAPGGGVTPVAKAEFRLTFAFSSASSKATKFSALVLRDLQAGTTIVVTCKGKGCPKGLKGKGFTKKNASGNVSLKTFIKKALPVGTVIKVVATKAGATTVTKTLTIRKKKAPVVKSI